MFDQFVRLTERYLHRRHLTSLSGKLFDRTRWILTDVGQRAKQRETLVRQFEYLSFFRLYLDRLRQMRADGRVIIGYHVLHASLPVISAVATESIKLAIDHRTNGRMRLIDARGAIIDHRV